MDAATVTFIYLLQDYFFLWAVKVCISRQTVIHREGLRSVSLGLLLVSSIILHGGVSWVIFWNYFKDMTILVWHILTDFCGHRNTKRKWRKHSLKAVESTRNHIATHNTTTTTTKIKQEQEQQQKQNPNKQNQNQPNKQKADLATQVCSGLKTFR